jgi:WD40 repeat protein
VGEIGRFSWGRPGYWINRVAFVGDGRHGIATGGGVILFDLRTGKELKRSHELQFARRGLAVSPDGRYFLTGHQSDPKVRLGEVLTGKEVRAFEGHTAGVQCVAFSPNGREMVSGSIDKTLRLWEVNSGKELRQFEEISDLVSCVAFSPKGDRVLSGHGGEGSKFWVRLWDVKTGKEVSHFEGHSSDVTAVAFLPDGKSVLSSSMDGTLRLWDVKSGKELRKMEHDGGVSYAAVSGDGRRAVSGGFEDRTVRLWDLTPGKELQQFEGHPTRVLGVAISKDGRLALSSDANNGARLWRLPR